MYIDIVPNRNSPPAVLLRESYREGNKIQKRTIANLSSLPMEVVEQLRQVLRGKTLVPVDSLFDVVRSVHHGHVQAVLTAMSRLGMDNLIAARSSQNLKLVQAMIAARILEPSSKLNTTRWWHTTTLPEELGISDADEDDLYEAMDWLLERQGRIEKQLAARHLVEGGLVLVDLSSTYVEGDPCPLAAFGYNRDKKKGKKIINFGLLTDDRGCPVAVSVFEGNPSDAKTLVPQVQRVQQEFGIRNLAVVGDRGMISQTQIDELDQRPGVFWITALRTSSIKKLVEGGALQLGLFDERNLFELSHPDYPGERLVACRNPHLAQHRAAKRQQLLEATFEMTTIPNPHQQQALDLLKAIVV